MTWQRHIKSGDTQFHAPSAIVFDVVATMRCRRQWPERDAIETHDEPPRDQRCDDCETAVANDGMIWRGLRELMAVQA